MTSEELEAFGKQIWNLGRKSKDPIVKIMCQTIHKNVMLLRVRSDAGLHGLMIKNLKGLQRHLGKPRLVK